nr:MAG TPA: hypothetical protein [Caudoviricetes sp.]
MLCALPRFFVAELLDVDLPVLVAEPSSQGVYPVILPLSSLIGERVLVCL